MDSMKNVAKRKCKHCSEMLDVIWFTICTYSKKYKMLIKKSLYLLVYDSCKNQEMEGLCYVDHEGKAALRDILSRESGRDSSKVSRLNFFNVNFCHKNSNNHIDFF